ncbi:MAG: tetratricopeptide repeat protein [Verrucomicrobiota bacterium]|nr:tetratricopeptide repeat protein [Verrucomicrobiota bacterium]
MKQLLLICAVVALVGCGKKAPERETKVPDANPPTQPPTKPKAEPAKAMLTTGMEAAKKAHEAGNYREAVRLYTVELAAEEAKSAPSWVQLSYLHNELGLALGNAGQLDKALEHYQKALAIWLKQLGSKHPLVAVSYNNIGFVHSKKAEYDKALEHFQKALAILLKQLGPEHPNVAMSYNNIGAVHYAKKDLAKAKEYWENAYEIFLKKLGPNHPNTKLVKGRLDGQH